MYVIHALWLRPPEPPAPRLALWAEDSARPAAPPRRPGRVPRVRPHPFAASVADLLDLLGPQPAATTETVEVHLPGGAGPAPSPELVRDTVGGAGSELVSRVWQVPVLVLDLDPAWTFLRHAAPPTMIGSSLIQLTELAGSPRTCVARGRLLPGVDPTGPDAVWRPVLTGPDARWARTLAASMPPPLARGRPGATRSASGPTALDALVDAAARAALGSGRDWTARPRAAPRPPGPGWPR